MLIILHFHHSLKDRIALRVMLWARKGFSPALLQEFPRLKQCWLSWDLLWGSLCLGQVNRDVS